MVMNHMALNNEVIYGGNGGPTTAIPFSADPPFLRAILVFTPSVQAKVIVSVLYHSITSIGCNEYQFS